MTLEEIVIRMRDLSQELTELTQALAMVELQATAAGFQPDELRQSARRFLSESLTDEERNRMKTETGIICPEGCTRKAALQILLSEYEKTGERGEILTPEEFRAAIEEYREKYKPEEARR